jgi:PTH1 family peptidyl-tRNA hydrolase
MAKDAQIPPGRALVVGLGNPGAQYVGTRHNIGFEVVAALAQRWTISLADKKFKGRHGHGMVRNRTANLLLPETYMNLSGQSVQPCLGFYKLGVESLVVAHDDIDLPLGVVRIKVGGGHGGHNGLRSLDGLLPSKQYFRIRLGVGRIEGMNVSSWVLGRFGTGEHAAVDHLIEVGCDAIEGVLDEGLLATQNRVHGVEPPPSTLPGASSS